MSEEVTEQELPEDEGRTEYLCGLSIVYITKHEKTFGVESLEWAVYHVEEAVT